MDTLHVRVYNVRFGDAIFISVPEAPPGEPPELRHILIDVGNSLGTEGGLDTVFEAVLQDVLNELAGQPLDLYIMTHEHLDHVQGLQYFQKKVLKNKPVKDLLKVRHAWLTRSAHPNYYTPNTDEYHEHAKKRKDMVQAFLDDAERYFRAAPGEETGWIQGLMAINNPRATNDCVDLIRNLTPNNTHYVYRGLDMAGKHPFQEATFEIWAPEEDTSTYYGPFQPVAFGAVPGLTARAKPILTPVEPPRGVDTGAFYNLVSRRRWGYGDNLLAIDSAANNTSIVFCLCWRGWNLLFPGDAEERSWKEMDKRGLLKPVHFFKISHHGSITGMLPDNLVGKVLKLKKDDPTTRYAALSAYPDLKKQKKGKQDWTYTDVPRRAVLDELKLRADLRQTIEVPDGGYLDYAFEGGTSNVTITKSK
jgi:hypothetical protein